MLDRIIAARQNGRPATLLSHLITIAGANHGSTLAQMGRSLLGYAQKLIQKHVLSVGAGILTDLDYGSEFLLDLNRRWLRELNSGTLGSCFLFSMGGDTIGEGEIMQVLWQLHERGSDDTVRISAANLNYAWLKPRDGGFALVEPQYAIPHLVLHGYSHFGAVSGILGNVRGSGDPPMAAVLQALGVGDRDAYARVLSEWQSRTSTWGASSNPTNSNATVVFSVIDDTGDGVDDCMIAWRDAAGSLAGASSYIEHHSPIQNNVRLSSYSFYINVPQYLKSYPHTIQLEADSGSTYVTYVARDFTTADSMKNLARLNEFTYVDVILERDSARAYAMYDWSPDLPLKEMTWMPFPEQGRIVLPSDEIGQ